MRSAHVQKDELLEIVKKNRERHRGFFERAIDGYREEAVRQLTEHIERIKAGKHEAIRVYMSVPQDHTADYDRVIRMLGMEVDAVVEVDERSFDELVMDRWDWKEDFIGTSATYGVRVE